MRMLFWAILVVDFSAILDDMSEGNHSNRSLYIPIKINFFDNVFCFFNLALADKRIQLLDGNR